VKRLAQLERELRVNEERWQAVMNNPIMGVTVLNADHRFIMTNPTFQTMVGYTDTELKKLTAIDITPSDQRDLNKRLFKELQEGKRNNYELIKQLQRKDGKLIWIQLHVFGIPDRGSVGQHMFGMVFDISERMYAQDALQAAQAELARSTQASRMSAMTASIVHEIKQPLAAIMTNANAGLRWIGQTPPNVAETRQALERILYETRRTDDVVQNIRAMFKSEGSSRTCVDLNELINEVLTLTKGDLQKRAIIVRTKLDESLPRVIANRVQLQQVLFNLVSNAIEAMESVGERHRQLLIKSEPGTDGEVSLVVEDSGTGIDPKHIERVFSSFFTTKDKGMGMGLSICRSIIESHGGRLWASRGSRHGSVFHFTLPVKADMSVKEVAMEENDDQRQFFEDLAATTKQGVEQIRGIEENSYAGVHWAILPLPWLTEVSERLQSYVEQHFKNGFDYALELSQAKDFQEVALINGRCVQKSLDALLRQATDFAGTYTLPVTGEKAPMPSSVLQRNVVPMPRFYQPDLGSEPDSPFARDANNKLKRIPIILNHSLHA
jgi:PAS domain S-box-containing protein